MRSSEQSGTYIYTLRDPAKQQIRLTRLDPANADDRQVSCHVKDYDLDSAPTYVTLSYTLDSPEPLATIPINNLPFRVRLNLFDFPQTYRNDSENTRLLWINQICILEAHHGERDQQVQLMFRIYIECHHVFGTESQDAATLLSKLEGSNN